MIIVRDRADARFLPSRHRFALFRLAAFLRLRGAKPERHDGLILIVDRDQTAFEHHGMSLWTTLTVTCYVAATLFASWPLPLAIAAALPVAVAAIEIPIHAIGFVSRGNERANSIAMMLLLVAAAAYFASHASWARFAARQFLGLVILNAVAAAIVFALRAPIARLESAVIGGAASEG